MKSRIADLPELENQLMNRLRPVLPDPQFRHRLEARLQSSPQVSIEPIRQPMTVWIIATGLAFGIFLMWLLKKS